MITLADKFLKEARRAGSKPTAIIGFVKEPLSDEAYLKSHWDAGSPDTKVIGSPSNIDITAKPGEVHIAKTLATSGVSQTSGPTNRDLLVGISGGGGLSRLFMTHPPLEERIEALRRAA